MSFCTKCGAQLPEGAAFCTKCGSPVQKTSRRRPDGREIWAAASAAVQDRWRRRVANKYAIITGAVGLLVVIVVVVLIAALGGRGDDGPAPAPTWQSAQTDAPQKQNGVEGGSPGAAQTSRPDTGGTALNEAELRNYGTFMRVSQLTDSGLNMALGQIAAPDDWQTMQQVQWSAYGNYPGMELLGAISPDQQRSFMLMSHMAFYQTDSIFTSLNEGEADPTTYRIFRQYRTADQYSELVLSLMGLSVAERLGSGCIDSQSLSAMQSAAQQHAYNVGFELEQAAAPYGLGLSLTGYEATVSNSRYRTLTQDGQTQYIELMLLVWAYQTSMPVTNSSMVTNEIYWCCPFTYIFAAESEQALEEMKNEYLTFICNSQVSPEFQYLVRQYRAYIENLLAQQMINQLQAANEMQSQLMQDYGSSSDTNDRVTEMWSDYIYDRDDYTTSDGSTVKVPTYYDHVYETDSGDIYVTNDSLNVPTDWQELYT